LTVGNRFSAFQLRAVPNGTLGTLVEVTGDSDLDASRVHFFWPKDLTFICPTEIAAFGAVNYSFVQRSAEVYGGSIDSEYVHLAWRRSHPDLADLPIAMLADVKRELSTALGILDRQEGVCLRATFIADPVGIIRHSGVNDLGIVRNPDETLRGLEALQTGELCPVRWRQGDPVLSAAERTRRADNICL
jgi:peroxiredoxin (alkyl hydroperoxide reductase subunit C)